MFTKHHKLVAQEGNVEDFVDRLISSATDPISPEDIKRYRENVVFFNSKIPKDLLLNILDPIGNIFDKDSRDFFGENVKNNKHLDVADKVKSIIAPTINTLVGEEADHLRSIKVIVTNPDAVSEKEIEMSNYIRRKVSMLFGNLGMDSGDGEIEAALEEIADRVKYSFQSSRERAATHIINHYRYKFNIDKLRNDGFKHLLATGEEFFYIDFDEDGIKGIYAIKPTDIFISGAVDDVEKADIIVINLKMSKSEIVDRYGEDLSTAKVKKFYEEQDKLTSSQKEHPYTIYQDPHEVIIVHNTKTDITELFDDESADLIDVKIVLYKKLRKVGIVEQYNVLTGQVEKRKVDGNYVPDKERGEKVKWYFETEWWQAVRIEVGLGNSDDKRGYIYLNPKPLILQRKDPETNKVLPPVVGGRLMFADKGMMSVIDMLKPLQVTYTALWLKLLKKLGQDVGNVLSINFDLLPKGIDHEKLLYWMKDIGIYPYSVTASGGDVGQYVAQFGSPLQVVNASLINDIIALFNISNQLKQEADDIVGVNRQRKGDFKTSDAVGVTQEALTRSFNITRYLFDFHVNIVKRLYLAIIDYVKLSIANGKSFSAQYFTDDQSVVTFSITNPNLTETVFDIVIASDFDSKVTDAELVQILQAAIQAGQITFDQYLVYRQTGSLDKIIEELRGSRRKLERMQQQQAQQEMQMKQAEWQAKMELAKLEGELAIQRERTRMIWEYMKQKLESSTRLDLEELRSETKKQLQRLKQEAEAATKEAAKSIKDIYSYNSDEGNNDVFGFINSIKENET